MTLTANILIDVVAILVLTFGLYWPRHRRKSMVVAYLTANIGVVAVASVLASSAVSAGLGLGLFGGRACRMHQSAKILHPYIRRARCLENR